jgi:hypothetical protein
MGVGARVSAECHRVRTTGRSLRLRGDGTMGAGSTRGYAVSRGDVMVCVMCASVGSYVCMYRCDFSV